MSNRTISEKEFKQFDDYGCASRCVINLSAWHEKPISTEEFIARFRPLYEHWNKQCGLIGASAIIDICRSLKLCQGAESFRSYQKIREILELRIATGIFLFTENDWDTCKPDVFHCSLVSSLQNDEWEVWTPRRNGQSETIKKSTEFLESRMAHFLALF